MHAFQPLISMLSLVYDSVVFHAPFLHFLVLNGDLMVLILVLLEMCCPKTPQEFMARRPQTAPEQ